jgi:hypothetical protein
MRVWHVALILVAASLILWATGAGIVWLAVHANLGG